MLEQLKYKWRLAIVALRMWAVRKLRGRRTGLHFVWTARHYDANHRLIWSNVGIHNLLHDEGEQYVLETAFSEAQSVPVNFYLGLDDRTNAVLGDLIAETDTLTNLANEPSGNGYARQAVASNDTDITVSMVGGDYRATTKTVTFTCTGSGGIGPVTTGFLCTVVSGTSGKLISSIALGSARTLAANETLDFDTYISLGEAV
jgi:hypothetical protein